MQAFVNVVVCDGVPFKMNQARVIQLFNDVLHADDTSYMLCDDPECLPYRARREAMLAMQDGAEWQPKYIKVIAGIKEIVGEIVEVMGVQSDNNKQVADKATRKCRWKFTGFSCCKLFTWVDS